MVDKLLRLFDSWVFRIRGFCGFSSGIWFLGKADVLNFTVPARHSQFMHLRLNLSTKTFLFTVVLASPILHAHKRLVRSFVSIHLPFFFFN